MELEDLTIIVPTKNEERNIRTFLGSLSHRASRVVVDASDDSTPSLVSKLRPENTEVIRRRGNVTEARQIGAERTTTNWLLFTDADISFSGGYFEVLKKYAGFDLIYGPKLSKDRYSNYCRLFSRGQEFLHILGIPAVSGSNLVIKRRVFKVLGGFYQSLSCNEDSELGWRAKGLGYKTTFAPELPVYAEDHRRLERGMASKTLHTLTRCALLYLNLMPERWRSGDWGYWQNYLDLKMPEESFRNGTE